MIGYEIGKKKEIVNSELESGGGSCEVVGLAGARSRPGLNTKFRDLGATVSQWGMGMGRTVIMGGRNQRKQLTLKMLSEIRRWKHQKTDTNPKCLTVCY